MPTQNNNKKLEPRQILVSEEIADMLENALAKLKLEHNKKVTLKEFTEEAIKERIKKLKLTI